MRCPYCQEINTDVIDSRLANEGSATRRRECPKCSKRFTTYERVEKADIIVLKKNGRKETFDRNKAMNGMLVACEKRPITREQINEAVTEIEQKLRRRNSVEVPSRTIGELIMKKLRGLDKVAYIRFASVYRQFEDVKSFKDELRRL